jgi:hypothetical protein
MYIYLYIHMFMYQYMYIYVCKYYLRIWLRLPSDLEKEGDVVHQAPSSPPPGMRSVQVAAV